MSTAYAFIPISYLESYKEIKMVAWRWRELETEGQEYDLLTFEFPCTCYRNFFLMLG